MVPKRVSQRDIAQAAKVHFTTVSLALRNSASLPEETRLRIQKLAEEMGYRPDPMLSALQAYRKTVKSSRFVGTIAWINCHKAVNPLQRSPFVRTYLGGAMERCEELGYKLETFNLWDTSKARLSNILQARNIQGLLLPPQPHNRAHLNFDWENYSAVAFGYSLSRPSLHIVANAQYTSARMGMRTLRKYGYRRIGFVTTRNTDERTDQNFSAGYLSEQRREKPSDQIPMLMLSDHGPNRTVDHTAAEQKKDFAAWYKKYRPTVVLTMYNRVASFMEEMQIPYTECGLALLIMNTEDYGKYAGIDQNDHLIGRSAVDFLVGMMHRNERGVPETPLRVLVQGKWIEGKTVFRQNLAAKNGRTGKAPKKKPL
jgi:LacI family repressor for deo operon, udp, cdd, tsx, nupC, and nupG